MSSVRNPRRWAVLVGALLIQLSCAGLYSLVPPNPDQMELNYAGWRMLHGEKPYVDILTINWPGTLWMHMGAIAAFGNTLSAWRIADALIMLATLAAVGGWFHSAFDSLTAAVVIVCYPLLFYAGGWLTGQRDFVAMHLMLVAAAFHWKAWTSANWRWQIGTGICVAYAALIKPPYFLALPALVLQGRLMSRSWPLDSAARRKQAAAAMLTTGVVLMLAPAIVVASGTPFRQLWEVTVQYHLQAYAQAKIPFGGRLWKIVSWIVGPWWWISALAAVSPLWFLCAEKKRTESRHAYLVLLLFLLVGVVSAVWQGQGLMYHASGVYVCLVLLALITVAAFLRLLVAGPTLRRIGACVVLACFLLGIASRFRAFYLPPLQYLTGRISGENYYSRFTAGELTMWEALSYAKTIRDEGAKVHDAHKTILVWSLANVINNESGYRNATRFHTPPILLLARPPFPPAAEWRRFFVSDIERAKPFACVVSYDPLQNPQDESVQFVRRLVHDHYRPVASTEKTTLYLRRSGD
jgi:hypothetical protein